MASKEYQGHHCRNCWNVALWIGNDEPLYRFALACLNEPSLVTGKKPTLKLAVSRFMRSISTERTPDGARYTVKAVRNALSRLE